MQIEDIVWPCCELTCTKVQTLLFQCKICKLQGVHLKNKGDLPEQAVEPVSTIGMLFKLLSGSLCCLHTV